MSRNTYKLSDIASLEFQMAFVKFLNAVNDSNDRLEIVCDIPIHPQVLTFIHNTHTYGKANKTTQFHFDNNALIDCFCESNFKDEEQ